MYAIGSFRLTFVMVAIVAKTMSFLCFFTSSTLYEEAPEDDDTAEGQLELRETDQGGAGSLS